MQVREAMLALQAFKESREFEVISARKAIRAAKALREMQAPRARPAPKEMQARQARRGIWGPRGPEVFRARLARPAR